MPSIRSTTAASRGASSLTWLMVSLNRSRVASRLAADRLRSSRVAPRPSRRASTCSTVTSALSAACASFLIRSGAVRTGRSLLSAMAPLLRRQGNRRAERGV
ncbi:hypothetical protein MPHLEI_19469 [Mycolicibacterium phlei RIVM601174]|nr:hypothetical protein MPHLEI_19469 [Mycolicibacterium phlei RIVM601174]